MKSKYCTVNSSRGSIYVYRYICISFIKAKMKRQATLQASSFTTKVVHRGTEVDVRVPRFVDDAGEIKCLKCHQTFVNKQGLSLHMKCIHPIYSAPEAIEPASNSVNSKP